MKKCFREVFNRFWAPAPAFPQFVLDSAEWVCLGSVYRSVVMLCLAGFLLGQAGAQALAARLSAETWPSVSFGIGLLPFQVAAFGGALAGLYPFRRQFGWRLLLAMPRDGADISAGVVRGAGVLLLFFPVLLVVNAVSTWVCGRLGVPTPPQSLQYYASQSPGVLFWVLAAVSVVILAPVTEEIMFRVITYRALNSLYPRQAAVLTSAVFALAHFTPQYFPGLFLLGMALQTAFSRGGLRQAIVVHALYNLSSLLLFLSARALGW